MAKKVKNPGYMILLILTIIFTISAILTLIPSEIASKECPLGYKAHCTFTPWSTIICLAISFILCKIRAKLFIIK